MPTRAAAAPTAIHLSQLLSDQNETCPRAKRANTRIANAANPSMPVSTPTSRGTEYVPRASKPLTMYSPYARQNAWLPGPTPNHQLSLNIFKDECQTFIRYEFELCSRPANMDVIRCSNPGMKCTASS